MPVYNSSATLAPAIKSMLAQSYTNFELIISDNASSDDTADICRYFASIDNRVQFHQQSHNIGGISNFNYVLSKCTGKFFMWAAGDDLRTTKFLEESVVALLRDNRLVASTSPNRLENNSEIIKFGLYGDRFQRFNFFLQNSYKSHGLFYSVMRIDVIRQCVWLSEEFIAWDWAVVLYIASHGEISRTQNALTIFGAKGVSNSEEKYSGYGLKKFARHFPFWKFTKKSLKIIRPTWSFLYLIFLVSLFKLNFRVFLEESRHTLKLLIKRES
jgi:glycosyltransferase involved in cell wall biosynthesis